MIAVSAILFLVCNTARPHRVVTLCGGVKNASMLDIVGTGLKKYYQSSTIFIDYVLCPKFLKTGNPYDILK